MKLDKPIYLSKHSMQNILSIEDSREFNRNVRFMKIDNRPKTVEQQFDQTVAMIKNRSLR